MVLEAGQVDGHPCETRRVGVGGRFDPTQPRLTGRAGPGSGKPMPLDPESGEPVTPSPIRAAWVEEVLVRWIEVGSPEN